MDNKINRIIGLGPDQGSTVSQLYSKQIVPNAISHFLGKDGSGYVLLGEVTEPSITYSNLTSSSTTHNVAIESILVNGNQIVPLSFPVNEVTLLDSETTFTILAAEIYDPLVATGSGAKNLSTLTRYSRACFDVPRRDIFPELTMNFAWGATMLIRPQDYMLRARDSSMSDLPAASAKHHFVLIHGSGGGAWCWYKIHTILESSGHKVTSLDLKGGGSSPTDPNTVLTFREFNQPFIHLLANLPDHEQVIIVGHSAGGLSLTYAIHKFGCRKIKMAIYVAANMLKHGFHTPQDFKDAMPDFSEYGQVNEYTYGLGPDQPPTGVVTKEEFLRKLVYNLTPDEEYTLAKMLLRPAPLRAFRGDQVQFTEGEDADSVPRVFIKTMHDKVVKPKQQDAMVNRWPPYLFFALESDHSPLLSAPSELAKLLLQSAASLLD